MKIDTGMGTATDLRNIRELAGGAEAAGFDGFHSAETSGDPFFPLLLAAEHTQRIQLMTSIAVAFARNPMIVASLANDLQAFSNGRFVLGLGSQIKPHIENRFSMPWSKPASRMREFVQALHAIWNCWYRGERLRFRGEFYRHTLMTPMFTPDNNAFGAPQVFLAAVGPKMTEVAGEVADGMLIHPFTTVRYLREVTLPAIERGRARSDRELEGFEFAYPAFVVTGNNEREWEAMRRATAKQLAFYGSTPAYRRVLDCHGWGELHAELNQLSKRGEWDAMGDLISDEVLMEFAVVAEPDNVASALAERFGGLVTRIHCDFSFAQPKKRSQYMAELRTV